MLYISILKSNTCQALLSDHQAGGCGPLVARGPQVEIENRWPKGLTPEISTELNARSRVWADLCIF